MPMLTALGEADWLPEPVDEELIPSPRSQASCRPGREIEVGPNHRLAAAEQEVGRQALSLVAKLRHLSSPDGPACIARDRGNGEELQASRDRKGGGRPCRGAASLT